MKGNVASPGCKEYNPCSLQAGGPDGIAEKGGGAWPSKVGTHGLCGDPVQDRAALDYDWKKAPYMYPSPSQATYTAGDIVEFEIGMCTEHIGFYEFRICDKTLDGRTLKSEQDGQDCLDKWVLERVSGGSGADDQPIDTKHPGRWHVPPGGSLMAQTEANWTDDEKVHVMQVPTPQWKMRYKIPEGLSCTACTLQWWWVSGNRCAYDADVKDYYSRNNIPAGRTKFDVCGKGTYGEEFWNCADITVKAGANTPPRRRAPSPPRRRKSSSSRRRRRKSSAPRRRRRRTSSRRRKSTRRRRKRQVNSRRRS